MKILTDIRSLGKERRPVVLAAGFFDGIHRGHLKVLNGTIADAARRNGQAWILTFDKHPLKVLKPELAPHLLTSNTHKLILLRKLALDGCILMPFTRKVADIEPEDFVRFLKDGIPSLTKILVGKNWRFGKNGGGTPAMLSRLGRELGFDVSVIPPVTRKGQAVSSTRIRAEVTGGRLDEAAIMLDRPFDILGTVTRGRTIGRQLGFPTANLDPHDENLPPQGVYAVRASLQEAGARKTRQLLNGVLNLGVRPTFSESGTGKPSLELHLFDFKGNLYGRDIEVFFVKRLRAETKFPDPEKLKSRIRKDIEQAADLLA